MYTNSHMFLSSLLLSSLLLPTPLVFSPPLSSSLLFFKAQHVEAARKLREHRRLSTTTTHRHLMATQDVKVAKVTEARRRGEAVRAAQDTAESIVEAERVATVASNAAQNAQTKAEAHAAEVAAVSVAEKERRAETSAKRQEMVERRSSGNVRTSWAGGARGERGGRGDRDHTLSLNSF